MVVSFQAIVIVSFYHLQAILYVGRLEISTHVGDLIADTRETNNVINAEDISSLNPNM